MCQSSEVGFKKVAFFLVQVLGTGIPLEFPGSRGALPWAGSSDIFYFPSFSKGGGWGSQRGGGNSSKIRGKRGTKGGGGEEG